MKKLFLIISIIVVAGLVILFVVRRPAVVSLDAGTSADSSDPNAQFGPPVDPTVPDISSITGLNSTALSKLALEAAREPFTHTYADARNGFSVSYTDGFSANLVPNAANATIISVANSLSGIGLQIEVSPFDDADTTITPDRIKRDIPDMTVNQPQTVRLSDQVKALAFTSVQGDQQTREVWFVHGNKLYQISAPLELDPFVIGTLHSWKFI